MLILMRAAQPQCHVMLTILAWGTVLGLRDADTESGTASVLRDAGTTDRITVFGYVMLISMRAAQPQCHVMLSLLTWGTVLGLRDDTDESGTVPVSRDAVASDMGHSFGVT
jgi:hypothetical protein